MCERTPTHPLLTYPHLHTLPIPPPAGFLPTPSPQKKKKKKVIKYHLSEIITGISFSQTEDCIFFYIRIFIQAKCDFKQALVIILNQGAGSVSSPE